MMFNGYGVWSIYRFEMARALRTLWQSLVTPVITTSLYFVVFGAAIGGNIRADATGGVPYGAFIVPGLIMLSLFTQSIFNASFGIFFPKFTGTIYELLSAPISPICASSRPCILLRRSDSSRAACLRRTHQPLSRCSSLP